MDSQVYVRFARRYFARGTLALTVGLAPVAASSPARADKSPAGFGERLAAMHAAVQEYQEQTRLAQVLPHPPPPRPFPNWDNAPPWDNFDQRQPFDNFGQAPFSDSWGNFSKTAKSD
jgi:hypothetical protein